jgi:hypothetical protein
MSDIEIYWNAIAAKAGDSRKWNDLERQLQDIVTSSVNRLIFVLSTDVPKS